MILPASLPSSSSTYDLWAYGGFPFLLHTLTESSNLIYSQSINPTILLYYSYCYNPAMLKFGNHTPVARRPQAHYLHHASLAINSYTLLK